MKRRDFLKMLAATPIAAVVPTVPQASGCPSTPAVGRGRRAEAILLDEFAVKDFQARWVVYHKTKMYYSPHLPSVEKRLRAEFKQTVFQPPG